MGETTDGLLGVVHGHGDTTILLVVKDLDLLSGTAVAGSEDKLKLAGTGDNVVLRTVLVTVGVTTNNNGLLPASNETGNARDDNRLTEDGTTKNVADSCNDKSVSTHYSN